MVNNRTALTEVRCTNTPASRIKMGVEVMKFLATCHFYMRRVKPTRDGQMEVVGVEPDMCISA